jgi:hypothetical protein
MGQGRGKHPLPHRLAFVLASVSRLDYFCCFFTIFRLTWATGATAFRVVCREILPELHNSSTMMILQLTHHLLTRTPRRFPSSLPSLPLLSLETSCLGILDDVLLQSGGELVLLFARLGLGLVRLVVAVLPVSGS